MRGISQLLDKFWGVLAQKVIPDSVLGDLRFDDGTQQVAKMLAMQAALELAPY